MTTDDLAPGASTFSYLSALLSNSIGDLPSLLISILMRLPAGHFEDRRLELAVLDDEAHGRRRPGA